MIKKQFKNIYLFLGQGADERLFGKLEFGPEYVIHYMHFPIPDKGETLEEYSKRFIPFIDTSGIFILIGVSLGGMICTELTDLLNPEKTILISSAKSYFELPKTYTYQRKLRLNRLLPGYFLKVGAIFLAPLVERDRKEEKNICDAMIRSKDPVYMKRSIDMIVNWKRKVSNPKIIHIHGRNDRTIPLKKVKADYIIETGSHMMVLTQAAEINKILNSILD